MQIMKKRFSKRIHTVKEFMYHLDLLISHPAAIKKANKNSDIHRKFIERIMLAVTQVNGCRLCSYAHTKIALENGLEQNEISALLSGDLQAALSMNIGHSYFHNIMQRQMVTRKKQSGVNWLKLQGSKESSLFRELGILVGIIPALLIFIPKSIIHKKRKKPIFTV